MKAIFTFFLLLSALLPGQAAAADNRISEYQERRRAVAALMEAATVWIVGEDAERIAQGSGFLVADGCIATNAHVVTGLGEDAVFYVLNDKLPPAKAQLVAAVKDSGKDFALLRFTPPQGVALPVLAFNVAARRMDRVSAWGYPAMVTQFDSKTDRLQAGDTRGLKAPSVVYTEGTINSIVSGKAGDALFHSAQIAGGNSGGPLVNSRGEVVGINTWGYTEEGEGAFLNAALPSGALAAFLAAHGVNPVLVSGQDATIPSGPESAQGRRERPGASPPSAPEPEDRIRDVGSFTVAVPRAWSVLDEEADSIFLGADDESAIVGIIVGDDEGLSLRETSRQLSGEFDGTRPDTDDDGETYTFTFSQEGMEYTAITADLGDGRHSVFLIGGDVDNPGVSQILDSVEDKEQESASPLFRKRSAVDDDGGEEEQSGFLKIAALKSQFAKVEALLERQKNSTYQKDTL